jgi:hypothetical protein
MDHDAKTEASIVATTTQDEPYTNVNTPYLL